MNMINAAAILYIYVGMVKRYLQVLCCCGLIVPDEGNVVEYFILLNDLFYFQLKCPLYSV